jgi:uncharacterized iron-regulated membrane protein
MATKYMTLWRRWVRRPQELLLRKVLFQIHLWTGIGVGLYVLLISVSGSVLVYRNELYRTFSPTPMIVTGSGTSMALEELKSVARRAYPSYEVTQVRTGETANHAVEITLIEGKQMKRRLFHPFTGEDLGDPLPLGFRLTAWLLDLHDNLLFGATGRRVNGIGALFLILLGVTGAIIWWPGSRKWRRSLTVEWRSNWKRLNWSLHSALGFWFFVFILMWGITGAYLSFPQGFAAVVDYVEPLDESNPGDRVGDTIQYWLAYLHFGRLGGRGIPGCGRGLCDSMTKGIWAVFGLVPPVMFVTGVLMWWNRVLRPRVAQRLEVASQLTSLPALETAPEERSGSATLS